MTTTDTPAAVAAADLSPMAAAERLVELSAAFKAAQPAPELHELPPEEAGRRLAEMSAAYNKSVAPKNAPADAAIVGEQVPKEFETTTWPQTTVRNKLDLVEHLRSIGVPDKGIAAMLSGEGSFSPEDVIWARQIKQRMLSDASVRAFILEGSAEAQRWLIGINKILLAEAK
jgi:hypothetical protein